MSMTLFVRFCDCSLVFIHFFLIYPTENYQIVSSRFHKNLNQTTNASLLNHNRIFTLGFYLKDPWLMSLPKANKTETKVYPRQVLYGVYCLLFSWCNLIQKESLQQSSHKEWFPLPSYQLFKYNFHHQTFQVLCSIKYQF